MFCVLRVGKREAEEHCGGESEYVQSPSETRYILRESFDHGWVVCTNRIAEAR